MAFVTRRTDPLTAATSARMEALFLHAPEVECIGKGKASAPYEFGVKTSIVTTNARAPGGQLVLHTKTLPGNPYDGHTLRAVIEDTQKLIGREIERAYVDKGYRGHDTSNPRRVFISGQKRGVYGAIKRKLKRRSAIEAVIGHMKADGHLGRCYLKGGEGDAANAILTAVGHNLRLVLTWLRIFCARLYPTSPRFGTPNATQISFLTANSIFATAIGRSDQAYGAIRPPAGTTLRFAKEWDVERGRYARQQPRRQKRRGFTLDKLATRSRARRKDRWPGRSSLQTSKGH